MKKVRVTMRATLEHKRHPSEWRGHSIERKENGWGIEFDDEIYKTKQSAKNAIERYIGFPWRKGAYKPIIVRRGINWEDIN